MKTYTYKRPREKVLIIGRNPVLLALDNDEDLEKILINKESTGDGIHRIITITRNRNIPLVKVPRGKLDAITDKNHQGIIAFRAPVDYQVVSDVVPALFEQGVVPRLVILDGVTDVRNAGAIARSAYCFGINALVVGSKGSAALNEGAVKASAGALLQIPVCRERVLRDAVIYLRECGFRIIATDRKAGAITLPKIDFSGPLAIVLGSEGKGISAILDKLAHVHVTIPMPGQFDSLNVSVAAGIIFYEMNRTIFD